jgi:antitoxin CcdA
MRSIQQAPNRPVNLSLNSKVLEMAKEMGMNISQTVDALLTEAVLKQYWEGWNERNKEAIAHYNARIAKDGLFSDRYRTFMRPDSERDVA